MKTKDAPTSHPLSAAKSSGGHKQVDGVAGYVFEKIPYHPVVNLEISDDRCDVERYLL